MWINDKVLTWLAEAHQELASIRTERDMLQAQLTEEKVTADWLRVKVNQLEMERAELINKAYGIEMKAPVLQNAPKIEDPTKGFNHIFNDIGDERAAELGIT